ncbi:MAG: rod shape-determining protein RodA, partial [Flavobacteriales bacterium]|nr:rod shape-determining protein RodA [Flavobacteriales bacterium]
MRTKVSIFEEIDWLSVALYAALVFFGWLSIYAANYDDQSSQIFTLETNHGKQ